METYRVDVRSTNLHILTFHPLLPLIEVNTEESRQVETRRDKYLALC